MAFAGGCLCGQVRFEIDAEAPLSVRHCWCRDCQYIGAGSGVVSAGFRKTAVTISGLMNDFVSRADSGSVMHRRFCARCGTQLFSEAEPRPHLIFVRVGALDEPNAVPPTMTIWTKSAPTWACFDPRLPALEGQPAPPPA